MTGRFPYTYACTLAVFSLIEFAILLFRVFEEVVQGGTPFEKGIQVDQRIGRKGSYRLQS